jgi:hypothetical protein
MLFVIPFIADWNKIEGYRQRQTDRNTKHESKPCVDWDYKVGDKVLLKKEGILHKAQSRYDGNPWIIMLVIKMDRMSEH